MATTYDIGDRPTVTGAFTNAAGTATAPTAVTVRVADPAGVISTYSSPNAAIVLGTSTTFTFPAALDQSGQWAVNMTGSAGVEAAGEIVFVVRLSSTQGAGASPSPLSTGVAAGGTAGMFLRKTSATDYDAAFAVPAATEVAFTPTGTIAAATVQAAIAEVATDAAAAYQPLAGLSDHLADTADAHDASAISVLDTTNQFAGVNVETVLAELANLAAIIVPAPTGVAATDTAAIQAALNTARLAGGGTVQLRTGTYAVTLGAHPVAAGYGCALTIGTKTTLSGAGRGVTVIKLAASQTLGNDVAGSNSVILNYTLTGGDVDIIVRDLTVDGDAANQTHTHAGITPMRVRSANFTRTRVTNCRGTAASGTNETFHFDVALSTDCTFTDCEAIGTAGSTASGFSANSSSNIKYNGCVAYGMSVAEGFTHNTCQNVQHVNCHSFLNGDYGFNSEASIDVTYVGCIAGGDSTLAATYAYASNTNLGNTSNGFTINGTIRTQVIGCIARHNNGNGLNGVNTSSGVVVGGEYTTSQFGGFSFDTSSLGAWSSVGKQINTGNGTPQYLNGVGTPVFGAVTAPAVPATTVAYTSIFPQDTTVHITGGTVTAVAVGGTTTGLTAGSFRVPPGQTITLTYSSAPTWTWFLG